MSDFEIDGKQYRTTRKLDVFDQLDVARKLAPLLLSLTPTPEMRQRLQAEALARTNGGNGPVVDVAEMMVPTIRGLAEMASEDVRFVTSTCASVVSRNQGAGWMPIWNAAGKRMMFEDIDAMALLQISWQVIQENLSNFIRAPLSASLQPSQTTGESLASMSS
jgi:hypothetical protein